MKEGMPPNLNVVIENLVRRLLEKNGRLRMADHRFRSSNVYIWISPVLKKR